MQQNLLPTLCVYMLQDVQVLTERTDWISKEEVNSMIAVARGAVLSFKERIEVC